MNQLPWSDSKAQETIRDVIDRTVKNFDPENFWPTDPNEDSGKGPNKTLYYGAAGVLWTLRYFEQQLNVKTGFDFEKLIKQTHDAYLKSPDIGEYWPSLTLGEAGLLLFRALWTCDKEAAEKLFTVVEGNITHPSKEALLGSPGTMLAALEMYKATKEPRWKDLYQRNANHLFDTWNFSLPNCIVWQQDLYEQTRRLAGAGHGFVGNVHALLVGFELLTKDQQTILLERTKDVVINTALIDGEFANWPYLFDEESPRGILVQWCHGAPGFITSLRDFPKTYSSKMEELLLMGGELTWEAGPLVKGVGICHSTDGNGWALLHLYKRTGDPKWLERARAFAMHAIGQRNGRYSVWTGELGLALFLHACITLDDRIPTLDFF